MKHDSAGNVQPLQETKVDRLFAFNRSHYGNTIREHRLKRELTQLQLAQMVGVSKNHVTNWEAGRARPDLNVIPALCEALQISLAAFFGVPENADALLPEEAALLHSWRQLDGRDRRLLDACIRKMMEMRQEDIWHRARNGFTQLVHNDQKAAAGTGLPLEQQESGEMVYVRKGPLSLQADEIVTVSGSSMEPAFLPGQDVYVRHTPEIAVGEIGLFVVNGEGFIKELAHGSLHSLNPDYADIPLLESDEVRCVGRVLGAVDAADYPTDEENAILEELAREGR